MRRPQLGRYGISPVIALAASVGACLLLLSATWRAIRVESVHRQELAGIGFEQAIVTPPDSTSMQNVTAAIDRDPFHPERRRPGRRFRLPGERRPQAVRQPGLPESVRLTGTIVYGGGGGAAILQRAGYATLMIRVGEGLNGLTLERVDREQATFRTSSGSEVVIKVSKVGG